MVESNFHNESGAPEYDEYDAMAFEAPDPRPKRHPIRFVTGLASLFVAGATEPPPVIIDRPFEPPNDY